MEILGVVFKKCPRCGEAKPIYDFHKKKASSDGVQPYCKQCNTSSARCWEQENQEAHRRSQNKRSTACKKRHPQKNAARQTVLRAVKKGTLVRPSECSECGETNRKIEAHHEDYSKPLDVQWLCVKCHTKKHHLPDQ